jgi:hypothetical protein
VVVVLLALALSTVWVAAEATPVANPAEMTVERPMTMAALQRAAMVVRA